VRSEVKNVDRATTDEDDDDGGIGSEETITYVHACAACDHRIAEHFYRFTVSNNGSGDGSGGSSGVPGVVQEYFMDCLLW
jgi:hypothetical protein